MKATLRICAFQAMVAIPLSALADPFCETVPANQYRLVSCNLSLDSIAVPYARLFKYREAYTVYVFDDIDLAWPPRTPNIPRGKGVLIQVPETISVCFFDPTNAPTLPQNAWGWDLVSCQSNVVANFEAIMGHAPMSGTRLGRLNIGGDPTKPSNDGPLGPDYTAYAFTNGAWSPSAPLADIGEAVLVYQPQDFVYQPAVLNPRLVAGNFAFDMETVYGRSVRIEYAAGLPTNSWQELLTFVGDGQPRTIEDPSGVNAVAQRFYRIQSSVP